MVCSNDFSELYVANLLHVRNVTNANGSETLHKVSTEVVEFPCVLNWAHLIKNLKYSTFV